MPPRTDHTLPQSRAGGGPIDSRSPADPRVDGDARADDDGDRSDDGGDGYDHASLSQAPSTASIRRRPISTGRSCARPRSWSSMPRSSIPTTVQAKSPMSRAPIAATAPRRQPRGASRLNYISEKFSQLVLVVNGNCGSLAKKPHRDSLVAPGGASACPVE